jgi:hypothetical protein
MHQASAAYLHHDKYIEDVKADRDGDEKVTGQHALGMIANKSHPALRGNRLASTSLRVLQQILLDGTGDTGFPVSREVPLRCGLDPRSDCLVPWSG